MLNHNYVSMLALNCSIPPRFLIYTPIERPIYWLILILITLTTIILTYKIQKPYYFIPGKRGLIVYLAFSLSYIMLLGFASTFVLQPTSDAWLKWYMNCNSNANTYQAYNSEINILDNITAVYNKTGVVIVTFSIIWLADLLRENFLRRRNRNDLT